MFFQKRKAARAALDAVRNQLKDLHNDLLFIAGDQRIPMLRLVAFFNATSPWQDRGGLHTLAEKLEAASATKYATAIAACKSLDAHISSTGRNSHGWNRTAPGQTVTPQNVFLGNMHGLATLPVAFWVERKDAPKGEWGFPGMENVNAYDVINHQAQQFMDRHCPCMIAHIKAILAA